MVQKKAMAFVVFGLMAISVWAARKVDINPANSLVSGGVPLTTHFIDQSQVASSWLWDFGDSGTSTGKNPTHTYNAQGSDTETKIGYITVSDTPYCESWGSIQLYEYIAGVAVADLNNPSGPSPYSDFTNLVAHITRGETVNVSLTPGFPKEGGSECWQIWIDYDGNRHFDEVAGEEVFMDSGNSVLTGSFTVPAAAAIGNTRMRVTMCYGDDPSPCGTFSYGEVEDYTVNIGSGAPAVIVMSPNGGEKWRAGSVHNITWNFSGLSANIKITFWRNGALLGTIANSINPAPRSYSWIVGQYIGAPGTTPAGSGYTIKIEEIGNAVSDMSDAAFSITN
jgi:PKD repeat protein